MQLCDCTTEIKIESEIESNTYLKTERKIIMALTKPKTTNTVTANEEISQESVQAVAEQVEQEAVQEQVEETTQKPATEEGVKAVADQEEPATKEVVAKEEAKAPVNNTERTAAATAKFQDSMADAGFEGLQLGGLSFEQIRLPAEGQFLIGQDDEELGQEFDCVIQGSRARYVVRQSDDQDAEMFYSYDPKGLVNAEGTDMADTLQEWADDGYEKPVIKKYLEVTAVMVNATDPDREGMMVNLSIAPASVQKFSGFIAQQQFMKKQQPNEYITRCIVGKKVKKDKTSFFPWAFKNAGAAPDLF